MLGCHQGPRHDASHRFLGARDSGRRNGIQPPLPRDLRGLRHLVPGRWEGQTLVVEITNFTDDAWGISVGIPSGAQKRVVERYRLTEGGTTLTIDFTLEDPEYLTEPIVDSETWRYMPGLELLPNKCDLEIAHRYLLRN